MLISSGVRPPFELAALAPASIEQLIDSVDCRFAVRDCWRADRLALPTASSVGLLFLARTDGDTRATRSAIKRHVE